MIILLTANTSFALVNFRSGLIESLQREGHDLIALAPDDRYSDSLRNMGVRLISLQMNATGTSIFEEIKLLLRFLLVLFDENPDVVLGYTIKNNIYVGIAARLLGLPLLANITGLGTVFDEGNRLAGIIKPLYRFALSACPKVFLQNKKDLEFFVNSRLISEKQAHLLPGSGVNLKQFGFTPDRSTSGKTVFLMVGRMLKEKGVYEFSRAAMLLRKRWPSAEFHLLGALESGKKGGLNQSDVNGITAGSNVFYLGQTEDVRPFVENASCVVLPSYYREGTPKSLLEAAAIGRPVITTDMPGCRDVVSHCVTGYICAPRDSENLAYWMEQFLLLSDFERLQMGEQSRRKIESEYDEQFVINHYKAEIRKVNEEACRNKLVV